MGKSHVQILPAEPGTTRLGDGNTLTRCNLRNCAINTTWAKRCNFEDCVLAQVDSAHRSTGRKSHFHNASSLSRSDFVDSIIRDRSSVRRSAVTASTVSDATVLKRSTVTGSIVHNSQLWRSSLTDCDVEDCAISRSDFKGMILKYGVWKKGQLVGKTGDKEPIMMRKDTPEAKQLATFSAPSIPAVPEIDSKPRVHLDEQVPRYIDSDISIDSEDSDISRDLPPPYEV